MTLTAPGHRVAEAPAAAPAPTVGPAVSLAGVTARYKGAERASVDRLNLEVRPGEIFGLLGPNGSGKTTIINMIIGLMAPSRGTVQVFGRNPASEDARRLMGVVTQETALYERLSAWDNLALYAALYQRPGPGWRQLADMSFGGPGWRPLQIARALAGAVGRSREDKRRRIEEALRLADLTQVARQRAGKFSGGMARRLQIARALIHSPHLIVLDEPTLGVDPGQRAELWDHIRRLRDGGKTVLLTTNVMEEAAALCDRIAIIHGGRLAAAVDTPANLQRGRGTVITVAAEAVPEDLRAACAVLRAEPYVTDVTVTPRGGGRYQVVVTAGDSDTVTAGDSDGATGKVIMHLTDSDVVIRDVNPRTATLDEVFLAVTGSFKAVR